MEKPEFETKLKEQIDKLPFEKHLDDGQYNDGRIYGFELGARWAYQYHVEPLQKENERLKKRLKEIKDDRSDGTNSNYTDPEAGRESGWSV